MAMNKITDQLWLGSYAALGAVKQMKEENITHVLSVISPDINSAFFGDSSSEETLSHRVKNFKHLRIDIDDVEDENIMQHFAKTNEFINDAVNNGSGCLVHCMAGVSRSATTVCAWLMRHNFWTPQQAIEHVKSKRKVANPNSSFLEQLQVYYDCGFNVSDNNPIYRHWCLKNKAESAYSIAPNVETYAENAPTKFPNTKQTKCFEILPTIVQKLNIRESWPNCRLIVEDRVLGLDDPAPLSNPTLQIKIPNQNEDIIVPLGVLFEDKVTDLKCKKCRCLLATSHQLIIHEPLNKDQTGKLHQMTRNGMAFDSSVDQQCTSYFIEPVKWMKGELEQGKLEGKLNCPKCNSKLGAYHWQGAKCSCGVWVTPGISLQRGRVDETKRIVRAKA